MKKLISLLLTGLMCANLTAPALAARGHGGHRRARPDRPSPSPTCRQARNSSSRSPGRSKTASPPACTTASSGRTTPCNISQILTFIWRMSGSPEPAGENPFRDVSNGKWYAAAAVWAHEKGIVSGDTLHPDAPCTRAMTVTYLWAARRFSVCVRVGIPRRKEHERLCCRRRMGRRERHHQGHHPDDLRPIQHLHARAYRHLPSPLQRLHPHGSTG